MKTAFTFDDVRLSHIDADALRGLLCMSWQFVTQENSARTRQPRKLEVLSPKTSDTPTLSVSSLGTINTKGDQRRQLQGQVRVNF
jgi:hypothetical protein